MEEMAQLMAVIVQERKNHGVLKKLVDNIKQKFLKSPAVAKFQPKAAPKSSAVDEQQSQKKFDEVEKVFPGHLEESSSNNHSQD